MTSASSTITVTVTAVNDIPVANDVTVTTAEDTAVEVTFSATDVEDSTFTFAAVELPDNGTLGTVGSTVVYTPNQHYNGSDTFTYTATDSNSGVSTEATVSITVTAVNDVPTTDNGSVTTAEDTAVNVTLNASDVDGDALTYAVGTATNGTVTVSGNTATYTPSAHFNVQTASRSQLMMAH